MDDRLLDQLLIDKRQRLIDLAPPPTYYKLSHRTLESLLPPYAWPVDIDQSAHLFGVPTLIDPRIPEGEVWITTDFETWQILKGT